ncbi:MAG: NADH-quinone oxidoreductase subunit C [Desulfatirhabdiaceae bacterium]
MSDNLSNLFSMPNGHAVDIQSLDRLNISQFQDTVMNGIGRGLRISAMFAHPVSGGLRMWAILTHDRQSLLYPVYTDLKSQSYPSLTPQCPQVQGFEREMFEQWALRPEGHPWLKPLRFHDAYRNTGCFGSRQSDVMGVMDFFQVAGEDVHEVAVGPVHAGIIEPGHFRFQCHGETVLHLEISLGYQHRDIERHMIKGTDARSIHYMETLAGDTTIGHATAYCQCIEALAGVNLPLQALTLRGIALELERIANHVGDLGALSGDVGFLPTLSYCGRIRGDVLNITALICGNRFGRGLLCPGGVAFDMDGQRTSELRHRLDDVEADLNSAIDLLWKTSSVMARFEGTGILSREIGDQSGLVGPVARASGIERDIRQDFPMGIFQYAQIPISTWDSGDVFARAYVRWLEIQRSLLFIREQISALPNGNILQSADKLLPDHLAVSLTEGWRGEICHVALTDDQGRFRHYKIVDPSFHNWLGLAMALRGQQISDFPLCNKSFNLSYCGHDL